jgi:putative transposase
LSVSLKRALIEPAHSQLSIATQCELLCLNRSAYYYEPIEIHEYTLQLMNMIDEEFTKRPTSGTRTMCSYLRRHGYIVNRKRLQLLYRKMGLEAIYPKRNLSKRNHEHKIFPYLLRNVPIVYPNQVWSTDITYIRMKKGFVFLMAILDWFSRYVIDWQISTNLESDFCIEALHRALSRGICEIFNTDQGAQFTTPKFTDILRDGGIQVSMDGKGRALDNVFVERLWRTVKYEEIYLKEYHTVLDVINALQVFFHYYNHERPHQSLCNQTPAEVYYCQ